MVLDPCYGMVLDPCYGMVLDPCYGMVLDPCYGMGLDPCYGMGLDPCYSMGLDPCYGMGLDPCYGMVLDPCYGMVLDPCYGIVLDPCYGMVLDPCYGMVLDPDTRQHDFRLNLDRHVIVHTFDPEFIVIEKLVESMSLAPGTLTFTPCNGWKVDKLCYKRQSTFILEDTFMVTISDVKECCVDWENYSQRNEGDHQLTVNLENSQDNHWELEV